ncbi:E3 ubiquitin-protein ligase RSL1-like [Phragmites australis]|uniref:E3 ubiquitin-protein ligase RSL1-like n=1 Tax=Phragmites australis TaxID=29695 RepID=UPI002D776F96|nr:E3 ubiquitin-protein ligase RSL1-like [Phragmites australis]
MANAARGHAAADDPYLQELIRGSVPGPSARARVAPLTDDEIGRFYCGICMETKLVLDRFRAAAGCAHEFCVGCLVGYIEGRVAEGAVPVPCPALGCRDGVMHPEACKKLLYIDVFDAWCVALCERAVGPGRARCPYRCCGELVVLEDGGGAGQGEASNVECPTCKREFCLQCEEPWDDRHGGGGGGGGQGCVLARLAQGRNWRRCPSCRAMIDKIDGCKRMVCRCGTVFCYDCGSPFPVGVCPCIPPQEDADRPFTQLNARFECKPSVFINEC